MQASARDSSFTIVGSSVYRPFFALMSKKEIATSVISRAGRLPSARSAIRRTTTRTRCSPSSAWARETCSGLLPAPTRTPRRGARERACGRDAADTAGYYKVEDAGFKVLANLADHDDIFAATTYLMRKSTVTANPGCPNY